jgi:hypothetical protein
MRDRLRQHFPTVAAFLAVLGVAASVSLLAGTPTGLAYAGGPVVPREPIDLPATADDADLDSYADGVDVVAGNLLLSVELVALDAGSAHPYVLVGTQDDHMRTGKGAELEWTHVVDHDPLGRRAGSPGWQADAIRTGTWVTSRPGEGLGRAVAETGVLGGEVPQGAAWPQTMLVDVRDDRTAFTLDVEVWDVRGSPDRLVGAWPVTVDLGNATWMAASGGQATMLGAQGDLETDGSVLRIVVDRTLDVNATLQDTLAQQWAPAIHFSEGERFFPVPGDALLRFNGFYVQAPDLRTWDLNFNNGRDTYRLLLADVDGDRLVDHTDAAILTGFVAAGDLGRPTVYAHVMRSGAEGIVVQYWFVYFYDYVLGEEDRGIAFLAHAGDRELLQLRFRDAEAALNGTPDSAVFGHHYAGLRISDPKGLGIDGPGWDLFVAQGSHAMYPVAGDDHRVRPTLVGYADLFDGKGDTWAPGNYTVEVLAGQPWHAGTLWGPVTRYSRDLGTSTRPLLNHDFRYPYSDPLFWEFGLPSTSSDRAKALFQVAS